MIKDIKNKEILISAKLESEQIKLAEAYIQGAIDCYCKNNKEENFSVRILFGGDNKNWNNTPLQCIYDYHCNRNAKDAYNSAAKDIGWLFKGILLNDTKRIFECVGKDTGNLYKMI